MTEKKTVACVIGVRRKKVVFEAKDGSQDYLNLKEAVRMAVKADFELNKKLQNSSDFVLQMKDPDFPDLGPIDLEPNAIIKHGSVVYVEFEQSTLGSDDFFQFKDKVFEEPKSETLNSLNDCQEKVANGDKDYSEPDINSDPFCEDSSNEELDISASTQKSDSPLRKTQILYPSPLPSVEGTQVENFKTKEEIITHLSDFVRFWTSDLSKRTGGTPLPSDYKNYALNILDEYGFLGQSMRKLKDGTTQVVVNHRPIVKKLSACLRNRKHWPVQKQKKKSSQSPSSSISANSPNLGKGDEAAAASSLKDATRQPKEAKQGIPVTSNSSKRKSFPAASSASKKQKSDKPSLLHPKGFGFVCSDQQHQDFLVEMRKTSDLNHQKLLMDATRLRRRQFCMEADTLAEMIQEYPELKQNNMVLYEFDRIIPSALETIERTLPIFLAKLSAVFKLVAVTTAEEFSLLDRLQEELTPNKSYGNQKVITVTEVFGKTTALNTTEADALKLVVFLDVDIAKSAYVVGENQRWEVPQPVTTSQCLAMLLAAYHVFDRQYPFAYRNIMTFFDSYCLELSPPKEKLHSKYVKFEQLFILQDCNF